MGDLDDRVRRLERHNRVLGGLAAVAGGLLLLAGARSAREPVVRAERFEVVDDRGNSQGYFGWSADQGVVLAIQGDRDVTAIGMGMKKDGNPYLGLVHPKEATSITMGFDGPHADPNLSILDGKLRPLFTAPPEARAARRPR